ncbi:hypothetical protein ZWY2020_022734 [Hordeum vulgare]|nr:hypothetical protein ZWY2020_022734 [Hordeum vulgare]
MQDEAGMARKQTHALKKNELDKGSAAAAASASATGRRLSSCRPAASTPPIPPPSFASKFSPSGHRLKICVRPPRSNLHLLSASLLRHRSLLLCRFSPDIPGHSRQSREAERTETKQLLS